jgi:hypothetical protein
MHKLLLVVAILVAGAPAGAQPRDRERTTLNGNPRGIVHSFLDKSVAKFFTTYPRMEAALVKAKLDLELFPGGGTCDVPDAHVSGESSTITVSPDGKTIVMTSIVMLDAKLAKRLGLEAPDKAEPTTVVIGLDGPSAKLWAVPSIWLGGCDELRTIAFTWSPDGKRALAVAETQVTYPGGTAYKTVVLVDVATRAIRGESAARDYQPSPKLQHVAARDRWSGEVVGDKPANGDQLAIDGTVVWGKADPGSGDRYGDVKWLSDTRLTFCGVTVKQPAARYQVELVADEDPKVTKLATACTLK